MTDNYQNTVCVITDASSDMGAAFVRELAGRGAKVVLFSPRQDTMQALAQQLPGLPGDYLIITGDITQSADRESLIQQTVLQWGGIDLLVNNAGIGDGRPFDTHTAASAARILETNLIAAIHLVNETIPIMIEQKSGAVIQVSSPAGTIHYPGHSLSNATNAGLSAFSRTLHREVKRHGIQVLDFQPGFTHSELMPEGRDAEIPLFQARPTEEVVIECLDALQQGKTQVMTGEFLMRALLWLEKLLPGVMDKVMQVRTGIESG